MYKRILVAVDGSDTSRHAFDAALALAQSHGAELQPYYVVENAAIYYSMPGYDPSVLRDQLVEQGDELAKTLGQRMRQAGVKGDMKVGEATSLSDVSALILDAAQTFGADLLVLGTHGRRGVRRLVLGSIAEQCLRHASMPVLLIPASAHAAEQTS